MNIFLILGILVLSGYLAGKLFARIRLPKIIGYIATGIVFSPNTMNLLSEAVMDNTEVLQKICLGFITFAIGGELKWKKIRAHEQEIINITWAASLIPLLLVTTGFFLYFTVFPGTSVGGGDHLVTFAFSILLAALASPTDPTATLAVIHQYKGKGKVKDTILGVAALDDALGILLFSLAVSGASLLLGQNSDLRQALLETVLHIGGGILTGFALAWLLNILLRFMTINGEGQWIVFIFSMIAICYGISTYFDLDELIACLTMGLTIANTSRKQKTVFGILERYTEELIFLFFFVLSGLHLNIQSIPKAILPILFFVLLRTAGKYGGCYLGGKLAKADRDIKKHTAGGLIPQGGVVIGLALIITQRQEFSALSELVMTVTMGATVINEIIGPLLARYSLKKAGEI